MRKFPRRLAACQLVAGFVLALCAPAMAAQAPSAHSPNRTPTGARAVAPKTAALLAAIAEVEAGRRSTPLIGEPGADGSATVTFLARRGKGAIPRIISDVTGWGERPDDTFDFKSGTMSRVGTTDWYCLQVAVASRARIEYLIAHGLRDYGVDPHNPRRSPLRGTPASEFVMPGYVPPLEFQDGPAPPAGEVSHTTIDSRAFGGSRDVIVYTPPGYSNEKKYPLAVFHGGTNVAESGVGPRVLDALIARRAIDPLVAVFVDSWPREEDWKPAALRAFLADELLAWVSSRYAVSPRAGKRAILGISFGAKDVVDTAVGGNAFGLVGLLIPGRRMTAEDMAQFAGQARRPLRVAILAGLYDAPNLPTAKAARAALTRAGHTVDYIEVPEGHNQGTWRNHLSDVLVSIFGTGRSGM